MPGIATTLLILTVLLVLLPTETYAFGAGDIPDFAYLNGKAFRHGDIEGILSELVKSVGYGGGGGLLGFAHSVLKSASGGSKFSRSDVKRVYFGNWLRDYSQAMDIAGLSKLTAETIVLVVSVLGFMTFGFATEEFEVTADRLGVYLPVEHIDNPKGYAEKEGDARQFHPKLRPPVSDGELEFDERTGMKKYMATEDEGFDSSTAFIRRTLRECIEQGRRSGGRDGPELFEAYRLLGTGLHTLEDLLAHSNWCEIALVKLGHEEVFCHVGDNVRINTPNGEAPPLVTGTFGGADFLHSLLGEAGDKLSQASVTDLTEKMNSAQNDGDSKVESLSAILKKLPVGGGDEKASQGEEMQAQAKAYNFDPDNIAPPDVQKRLMDLLKWRDQVYRDVVAKIEMIPGLADLIDELTNALNAYVFTVLAPYLTPILQQVTGVLDDGSKAVIDSDDQFAVFDNPDASDPSHSMLSKDHFGLILNEPAGKIAQVVVEHTVNLIVKAWGDDSNPDGVLDEILEAFHHPYYATGQSNIQHKMFEMLQEWFGGLGPDMESQVIEALSKESVRNGKNKRVGSDNEETVEHGYKRESYGGAVSHGQGTYTKRSDSEYGGHQESSYGRKSGSGGYGENRHEQSSYEQQQSSRRDEEDSYSSRRHESYGGKEQSYGFQRRHEDEDSNREEYGHRRHGDHESRDDEYSVSQSSFNRRPREDNESSGHVGYVSRGGNEGSRYESGGYQPSYSQPSYSQPSYSQPSYSQPSEDSGGGYGSRSHGGRRGEEEQSPGYGRHGGDEEHSSGYGSRRHGGDEEHSSGYGGRRYGGDEQQSSGYGGRRLGEGEEESSGYGSSHHEQRYGERSSGYGGDHHAQRYGGEQESSGYAPSYGHSDETFGAERLNLGGGGESYGSSRYNQYEENEEGY